MPQKNEQITERYTTIIDYLTLRIREYSDPIDVIEEILHLDANLFQIKIGQYRYKRALCCGNISVFFDGTEKMGICIQLTGAGCMEYCALLNDPNAVLHLLRRMSGDYATTRIDLAMDDFNSIIDLDLISTIAPRFIRTKLAITTEIHSRAIRECNKSKGRTVYFGSSSSDYCIRFYDKAAQTDTHDPWVRVEQQLRHKEANSFVHSLTEKLGDASTSDEMQAILHEWGAGLLLKHLAFVVPGSNNKSRAKLLPWWESFLGTNKRLALENRRNASDYATKEKWIREKVSLLLSAQTMIQGTDWLLEILLSGIQANRERNSKYAVLAAEYQADGNIPAFKLNAESEKTVLLALSDAINALTIMKGVKKVHKPKPLSEYPDLMTVPEVAEYLRCSTKTVYELVRAGRYEKYMVGNQIRIIKSSLLSVAA